MDNLGPTVILLAELLRDAKEQLVEKTAEADFASTSYHDLWREFDKVKGELAELKSLNVLRDKLMNTDGEDAEVEAFRRWMKAQDND